MTKTIIATMQLKINTISKPEMDDSGLSRFKLKEIVSDLLSNIPKGPNPDENPLLEHKKYDYLDHKL